MAGTAELPSSVVAFADRLAAEASGDVEGVLFSPYPFRGSQLLVVCREEVRYIHEVVALAERCGRPDVLVHWLRPSELHLLSAPYCSSSIWFWWTATGGYPAWSYWLRHKGVVLRGRDVRAEIALPEDPKALVAAYLAGHMTYNRAILPTPCLLRQEYQEILKVLGGLTRRVMATGLLLREQWDIREEEVLDRFACAFGAEGARGLCAETSDLFCDQAPRGRESALAALLATECLVRFLRRYVE